MMGTTAVGPFLAGAVCGFAAGVGVVAALDARLRYTRRALLGFSARALANGLGEIAAHGDLTGPMARGVGRLQELAAELARAASE